MGRYITYEEYKNNPSIMEDPLNEEAFNRYIVDAEMSIDDFTYRRLKNDAFFKTIKGERKELLNRALVKTVEGWATRSEVFNDFGMFHSLSVGEFEVSVPRSFEDNPQAYGQSMTVPTIAKRYLQHAGLRYAGNIA